ncbi:N-acetylmuramoyl-L-alanine amidase [Chachezhania sediminis]|uniref:N-acetylmuramoyl-L-alanine amidase n=1 Tax=Chachezhania sediminis TaxID=2599291 RepID=UPI0018EECD3D|nr:N-acetylmuramoyl-L-alanine amidase [Chachezhania sediminis]
MGNSTGSQGYPRIVMRALALAAVLALAAAGVVPAQGTTAPTTPTASAVVDSDGSHLRDLSRGRAEIVLHLARPVPYRIFTLTAPPRLVIDFRKLDWSGIRPSDLLEPGRIAAVHAGTYIPGWSRLVAELATPLAVETAQMTVDDTTGAATLTVLLEETSSPAFAASAGVPQDPRWDLPPVSLSPMPPRDPDAPLVVVLDPGHGGIDPGAEAGQLQEKSLMLAFARELQEELLRAGGYKVILTRNDDRFVSLETRVSMARAAGADVFISLHADALSDGLAHGATVHVLSEDASDIASATLAERHDRGDILSGSDLTRTDDEVTGILLDLARQETQPRSRALAQNLVSGMSQAGGPMNRRPLRSAAFSVLKSADVPSVLIEIGFMSSPRDFRNLQDPNWRLGLARGIRRGLDSWRVQDAARHSLVRQ